MKWKTSLLVLAVMAVALAILFKIATRVPQPPVHQVFIQGEVLTMDSNNQIAQAVSVRGERIEAVGSNADIMQLVTDETVITDLRGRTLMPGFIDAHGHFPGSALTRIHADLNSPPIGKLNTMAEVMAALSAQADKTPDGDWVVGMGYDDTLLAENRHPTRAELDQVSSEHPVVAVHVSGHMVVVNSAALAVVGIDASTADPEGGVIGRRSNSQEPNGLLQENAQWEVAKYAYELGAMDSIRLIKMASTEYAAIGVTTAQSGGVDEGLIKGVSVFIKLGVIPIRVVLFPAETELGESLLTGDFQGEDYASDRLTIGPVKLIADGSIQGYTGYLTEPYYMPYHGEASYLGYPSISRVLLFEKVKALHQAGHQMAIHANGDASIDDALDAFAAAQKLHPVEDPRLILIHAQMAREDQIVRMKELGVTPSFFSAHTWYWGDRHRDIFMGPERAENMSPAGWAQDNGLRYSTHLDTPVTPMQPLQSVWSTAFRITHGGQLLGPQQRVSVMQALRSVTIDAAWQVFEEDNRGSLEPGKYADMIILSGSPLKDPMAMRELKIKTTLVGGATIYQSR